MTPALDAAADLRGAEKMLREAERRWVDTPTGVAVSRLLAEYDRRGAELDRVTAELADEEAVHEQMRASVIKLRTERDAVLAIHRPVPGLFPPSCQACREHEDYTMWPCDTAAALGVTLGDGS